MRELASLTFPDQAVNVLFVGGPGVGKTHLGIALAIHACTARRSVLFTHAPDLVDQLLAADASHTLRKVLDQLRRLYLLVVDEHLPPVAPRLPAGAPTHAAASAGLGNDKRQDGGAVVVQLDIDQTGRRIILLDDLGAPVKYAVPPMVR